jgi:hypothetical protein
VKRGIAALLCLALLAVAPKPPPKHVGKQVLPIALVLNGTRLAVNPAPVFYKYHLLVPVRRVLSALGLAFDKQGDTVRTYAGAKTITLQIGSGIARVDSEPVQLDTEPVEIKNTLYAPLRFFTDALGAQAVFDRQTNSVEIISTLVGRSGNGIVNVDGGVEEMGTVGAIDLNSDPITLTLTFNASVRTLPIDSDATVIVQDVNTGTSNSGDLDELHVGDFAQVSLDRRGHVKHIVDAYGSRNGMVAAAGSGELVLNDGHVIVPSRDTTITLNTEAVGIDAIHVGDDVMVRYNIDSSEVRQIVATRKSTGPPPVAGPVAISAIVISPVQPLRAGEVLNVTMHGTPGGLAAYDIGPYITNLTLTESQPGVYAGSYEIRRGQNFANAPVFGHLNVRGADAPAAESADTVSVSTEAPGVADFAPDSGSTVNNPRPSVYATFVAGTVPVNPSSERLEINGHDVTSGSTRTAGFIDYTPGVDYSNGPVRVTVTVADEAGNQTSKSWVFYIRR